MSQSAPVRPGSPAASHMLWFFIFPILALIIFATWKLGNSLLHPEVLTLGARLERLEKASNAGERWKEAYGVAQEIHKKKSHGEWQSLAVDEKRAVYKTFSKVLFSNESDARVARYLLVTLGQLGERESLPILKSFHTAEDPDLVFYSVWAYSQSVISSKAWDSFDEESSSRLLALLKGDADPELKKIICAFISQGPMTRETERSALIAMLDSPALDLRLSAAISLLPRGLALARTEEVLSEMLSLETLHNAQFKNLADMKQSLSAVRAAVEKAQNQKLLARAKSLAVAANGENPEGRSIKEALHGL
jgi:hypothetical protein